ncbi:MAG: cytidylyltransferase domain-containing protein, partial [Nitrospinota bacterium]
DREGSEVTAAVSVLGVITARGGSKRLPLKNLKELNGIPLIAYCVCAALESRCLERVVVSTDHEGIAETAKRYGAEVPFRRPAELAEDVPSEWVTQHAVQFCEAQAGGKPIDIAVTIQPTTPFLTGKDIDACVEMLRADPSLDSVITVTEVTSRPEWMYYKGENGIMSAVMGGPFTGDSTTLQRLFLNNGAAFATRRATLFEQQALIGKRTQGHWMERIRSIDIDDEVDWMIAEMFGRSLGVLPQEK